MGLFCSYSKNKYDRSNNNNSKWLENEDTGRGAEKYQNNLLTVAHVIEELVKLAKDICGSDKRGEDLNLGGEMSLPSMMHFPTMKILKKY